MSREVERHEHKWIEVTILAEAQGVQRYICGLCGAKRKVERVHDQTVVTDA